MLARLCSNTTRPAVLPGTSWHFMCCSCSRHALSMISFKAGLLSVCLTRQSSASRHSSYASSSFSSDRQQELSFVTYACTAAKSTMSGLLLATMNSSAALLQSWSTTTYVAPAVKVSCALSRRLDLVQHLQAAANCIAQGRIARPCEACFSQSFKLESSSTRSWRVELCLRKQRCRQTLQPHIATVW